LNSHEVAFMLARKTRPLRSILPTRSESHGKNAVIDTLIRTLRVSIKDQSEPLMCCGGVWCVTGTRCYAVAKAITFMAQKRTALK